MFYFNENQVIPVKFEFGNFKIKINDDIFDNVIIDEKTKILYMKLYVALKDKNLRKQIFDFSDYEEKTYLFDMKNELRKMMVEERRIGTLVSLEELNELNVITLEKVGYLIKSINLNHPSKWKKNFKPEMKRKFLDYEYN